MRRQGGLMKSLILNIVVGLVWLVNGLFILYEPFVVYRVGFLFQIPRWVGAILVFVGVYAIVYAVGEARRKGAPQPARPANGKDLPAAD